MGNLDRIDELIKKGEEVFNTSNGSPYVLKELMVDSKEFSAWKTNTIAFLESILPAKNNYLESFKNDVKKELKDHTSKGIGILESIRYNMEKGYLKPQQQIENPLNNLILIFERFHIISDQLKIRHKYRHTIEINDEYDVQDLLHALLKIYFDDIRPEEWTPSSAGQSARMDFLLKKENIIIEVKKTRRGLDTKEVGKQLIEDSARYEKYPNCNTLICFVYDPDRLIGNPRGLESDLKRDMNNFHVEVFVRS